MSKGVVVVIVASEGPALRMHEHKRGVDGCRFEKGRCSAMRVMARGRRRRICAGGSRKEVRDEGRRRGKLSRLRSPGSSWRMSCSCRRPVLDGTASHGTHWPSQAL